LNEGQRGNIRLHDLRPVLLKLIELQVGVLGRLHNSAYSPGGGRFGRLMIGGPHDDIDGLSFGKFGDENFHQTATPNDACLPPLHVSCGIIRAAGGFREWQFGLFGWEFGDHEGHEGSTKDHEELKEAIGGLFAGDPVALP
jgi:hypothetical protein